MMRVVRVGGSLLTWDRLPGRLQIWLESQSPATNVLIAGGGPWVELIRQLEGPAALDDEAAHWLSVRAMGLTSELLVELMRSQRADLRLVAKCEQLRTIASGPLPGTVVFDVNRFLREVEMKLPGRQLPRNWDVTSDSIAARLAEAMEADELVLLKPVDLPQVTDLPSLAACGYVDQFFPVAAEPLRALRFVNLRTSIES